MPIDFNDLEVKMGYLFTESGDTVEATCELKAGYSIDFSHDGCLYMRLQEEHIKLLYGWILERELRERYIQERIDKGLPPNAGRK